MGVFNRLFGGGKEEIAEERCEEERTSPLPNLSKQEKEQMITMTEAAQEKIRSIIASKEQPIEGLRLGITGGGEYTMSLVEEGNGDDSDTVVALDGFQVLIDAQSAPRLKGATVDFVEDLHGGGFKIDNPNEAPAPHPRPELPTEGPDGEIAKKVQDLLETTINPAVAGHGGVIALLDVQDGVVYLQMGGGCQGCGMANVTLKAGVERLIREEVPEVVEILDVTDHAGGKNPYYAPATR